MVRKRGRKPTYAAAEIEGSLAFWTQAEPVEIGHGTADFLTARGKQFRRIPPAASAGVVNTYCPEGINFAKPCPIPPDFIDAILRFHVARFTEPRRWPVNAEGLIMIAELPPS